MASWTHVQTKTQAPSAATSSGGATSLSETFASQPSVNNLVVAYITAWQSSGADPLTGVADNQGNGAYTIIPVRNGTGANVNAYIAYKVISSTGTPFTVTASFSSNAFCSIVISEFDGGGAGIAIDGSPATATGSSVNPAGGALTPSGPKRLFLSCMHADIWLQ